ncbi:DUF1963 domain-containing protein [Roseisolibacter sp. H3M3-2]|uniref:DUF1963 domain-containing protein n=1 Tax=Roseisolibacter sp. H3M3-2 TaxID=3031323 RepID=UPI0023DA64AF|nr:DUF1963 domain-containing protein [Roseisolibacter sp. H3M3-2]MDF1502967.1 DUF1963 domain-containing protein [Roseisolibacter sp. H3M3-2]
MTSWLDSLLGALTGRDTPPAPARAPSRPQAPHTVEETVSAVLRRQMPVRFGEPPRSWLGGLPRMPEHVEWPRDATPLHFVAQVACADLPPALWGGLGPREGWLLLFLDAQAEDLSERAQSVRVLHVPTLGPERHPPDDSPSMRDEGYEGYDYRFLRSGDEIPPTWRGWPVDVVALPDAPDARPENLAATLYPGAPVAERMHPQDSEERPYTWRGALYVVDSAIRALGGRAPAAPPERDVTRVEAPGWAAGTIAALDAASAEVRAKLEATPLARAVEHYRGRLAELADARALLLDGDAPIAGTALLARLQASRDAFAEWRASARGRLDALRTRILAHDLDSAMSEEEFRPIHDALAADAGEYWALGHVSETNGSAPVRGRVTLQKLAARGYAAARWEVAADLYVASPEQRALIPPDLLARAESHWRALKDERPHRMGGTHDGVQSDPAPSPRSRVLLFQMASDYAVQWCWGDVGAIYVWIDVARLAAHDFSTVEAWLECH